MNKHYSQSLEDYLEAIACKGGTDVKSIDLANHLNVSRASVNKAINSLIEKGLVEKEHYGNISLTLAGKQISDNIVWKHNLLKTFLTDILEVKTITAEEEACGIEHSISDETAKKLEALINKLK